MDHSTHKPDLPENAYRELRHGEIYRPVMSPEYKFPEVTSWSLFWGLFFAVVFSAAAAYSGLKIGQVMEAAIPISILAVGVSTAFKKKGALGQNVIIQSIGGSSGVIVAGAVFTIPALYILQLDINFVQIFFAAMFGGFLGILFLIPFRKYFVKDMHGKFPFPEATATTEILITGEKGGAHAGILVITGLIGGLYDFMFSTLHLWSERITSNLLPYGAEAAKKIKLEFQLNVSAMIFGFGYLIGLKYATIITVGSLLSWFVIVPLINQIGAIAAGPGGTNFFALLSAGEIFTKFVRPIGIGAIAMAGIIGILKSSKVIGSAFGLAFKGIFGGKAVTEEYVERTQKDIKMTYVLMFIALTIIAIFIFLIIGVNITFGQAVVALLTIVIISFLFTTVAANAIAIVGSNPVSGMTLMTLILSSFILVQAGLTGSQGITSALIIGGIVCTALSMAGGFITDLKVGYWLGSTPIKQQSYKFLGTILSAATVGMVIFILNASYGFTRDDYLVNNNVMTKTQIESVKSNTASPDLINKYQTEIKRAEPLVAPQANAMAAVIQPLMTKGANINWTLYLVGALIAVLVNWLGISPLAFALGMYIPLQLNTPLIIGGLVAHFVGKSSKDEKISNARLQRGTLVASGFMAGASIFGVIGALLLFIKVGGKSLAKHLEIVPQSWADNPMSEYLALIMFVALAAYVFWESMRAKEE